MKSFILLQTSVNGFDKYLVISETAFGNGFFNTDIILHYTASGTQIGVTGFRIARLTVFKTYIQT